MSTSQHIDRSGWTPRAWCEATSISKSKYDTLPPELKPASIKLGRRRIITEAPAEWLRRVGALRGEAA